MNDMERIQRGLEDFLRQQQQETRQKTCQQTQKEIDLIGTDRRNREYETDWDAMGHPRRTGGRCNPGSRGNPGGRSNLSSRNNLSSRSNSGSRNRRKGTSTAQKAPHSGKHTKHSQNQNKKKNKKKKFSFKRLLLTVALVIALLAAGLYWAVGQVYSKLNYHEIESVASAPMKEDGVINILLIGNDSRQNGEDGRSDAMILLSVSTRTKKIYMTSLLRDMYVEIPGHDGNRLNAAYSFGGAELLMETVEKNLGITVNRYMSVNFEAFANLVDAAGGVDLELSSAEIEWVNAYLNEYNLLTDKEFGTDYMDPSAEGMVHLNGPQALAYARNRYIGTDFGRTERQRKVLAEVVHKLPKTLLLHPGELVDGLMPNLTTNLTQWECYRLSLVAPQILTYEIEQGSIPLQGTYQNATIRGMAVLDVDFEANREYLHKLLFEPQEEESHSEFTGGL
ncbi:MAG: LCP family protein [Muribaculum sp.]|nr:LCP family protein [Muribaculum sp.]